MSFLAFSKLRSLSSVLTPYIRNVYIRKMSQTSSITFADFMKLDPPPSPQVSATVLDVIIETQLSLLTKRFPVFSKEIECDSGVKQDLRLMSNENAIRLKMDKITKAALDKRCAIDKEDTSNHLVTSKLINKQNFESAHELIHMLQKEGLDVCAQAITNKLDVLVAENGEEFIIEQWHLVCDYWIGLFNWFEQVIIYANNRKQEGYILNRVVLYAYLSVMAASTFEGIKTKLSR